MHNLTVIDRWGPAYCEMGYEALWHNGQFISFGHKPWPVGNVSSPAALFHTMKWHIASEAVWKNPSAQTNFSLMKSKNKMDFFPVETWRAFVFFFDQFKQVPLQVEPKFAERTLNSSSSKLIINHN